MSHNNNSSNLILNQIDITPLLRAQNKFESFRQNLNTEQEKAGAVQAFEYCFELCWKMTKRILEAKGISSYSARDAFREGARNAYIADPEIWFDFLLKRNLSSHVYNEETMAEVLSVLESFSKEMNFLIMNLQQTK